MVEGRDNSALPASVAFDDEQQQCLSEIAPSYQGQTRKQQNPYPPASLPWATWLIARLGGWSGYRSQRPPPDAYFSSWAQGMEKGTEF